MKTKQTIFKFLKSFLVIGIYLSFFAVQLLYNFDLANSQKSRSERFAFNSVDSGHQCQDYFQKSSFSSKANIRLNKRFEPNSFADCIAPVIEICLFFHTPEKLGFCYEVHLLSSIELSVLLRGPPSVA
jgi:hypothetical protein